MNDEPIEESAILRMDYVPEIRTPCLSVVVDFNMLLSDKGEQETWDLLGKLKDLLG